MMRPPKGIPCLCGHAWTRHRGQYGEAHGGACRNCVCEVFEVEPVEASESAPQLPPRGSPPSRGGGPFPEVTVQKLKVHPAAELFPMMSDAELDDLALDLKANGQKDKITLLPDGRVIDGRNRLEACRRAGVEPKFETLLAMGESPTAWVISKNLKRRHLNPTQMALVAADAVELFAKEAKERQRAGAAKGGASKLPAPGREASGRSPFRCSECKADHAKWASKCPQCGRWGTVEETSAAPAKAKASKSEGTAAKAAAKAVGAATRSVQRAIALKERASTADLEAMRAGKKTLKQVDRETKRKEQVAQIRVYRPPEGEYPVIAIDPPWKFDDALDGEGARGGCDYPPMELEQICAIKIPAAKDCVLWCWTTNTHLADGSAGKALAAWGFTPKTILTWAKTTNDGEKVRLSGGRWLRGVTEHVILAVRGRPLVDGASTPTLLQAPRPPRHSEKPAAFYQLVEKICPARPLLEMFARDPREGWFATGSELKKPSPDVRAAALAEGPVEPTAPPPKKRARLKIHDVEGDAA